MRAAEDIHSPVSDERFNAKKSTHAVYVEIAFDKSLPHDLIDKHVEIFTHTHTKRKSDVTSTASDLGCSFMVQFCERCALNCF